MSDPVTFRYTIFLSSILVLAFSISRTIVLSSIAMYSIWRRYFSDKRRFQSNEEILQSNERRLERLEHRELFMRVILENNPTLPS